MRLIAVLVASLVSCLGCFAGNPKEVVLWPQGVPDSYKYPVDSEYIEKNNLTEEPFMQIFEADHPSGVTILCCPGGGYAHLAVRHEGADWAEWLNGQGVTLAVLHYRMPYQHHNAPLDDVHRAMHVLRDLYSGDKVGILGFSAGGHLASTAATHYGDSITRPDFQILFYPVISLDESITHSGTRWELIGDGSESDLELLYSNDLQVKAGNPDAFIVHCADDTLVPVANSLRYAQALVDAGVSTELLIFPTGGHGWGFNEDSLHYPIWSAALSFWLAKRCISLE